MKTIIAPTDFSTISYNACLYAAKMAEDISADLILLHVMELPVSVAEFPVMEDMFDEAGTKQELEALKKKLGAATNNKVPIYIKTIIGSAEYEIKEFCEIEKPFAVIMSTHTTNLLDRFFLGSTTIYSAKHLHFPVIVVPNNTKYRPVKKVALASDLKDIYDAPAHEIKLLVKNFKAEFEIFYAGKNQQNIARKSVASLTLDHRLVQINPQFFFIQDEDVFRGISTLAKQHDVDILLIIPKAHSLFHKSTSNNFIFNCKVPLMVIHENDIAEYA